MEKILARYAPQGRSNMTANWRCFMSRISVYGDARFRDLERRGGANGRNSVSHPIRGRQFLHWSRPMLRTRSGQREPDV